MNEQFYNIGNKLSYEIPGYNVYRDFIRQRINYSFYLEPIASDGTMLEIKKLQHNKSPGHDIIGSKIIKLCPEMFTTNIYKIYNRGIDNEKYPDGLEIAKIIALYIIV